VNEKQKATWLQSLIVGSPVSLRSGTDRYSSFVTRCTDTLLVSFYLDKQGRYHEVRFSRKTGIGFGISLNLYPPF
jgi:hypothetical protein